MHPIIATINSFDEFSVRMLGWYIQDAKYNNQRVLPVVIDSYGGEVYSLRAMVDMLDNCGLEYFTVTIGKAMSCGAFLLAKGKNKRWASPLSRIMIHEASRMVYGKNADIQSAAKEISTLNKESFDWLDSASNKPSGFFQDLVKQNGNGDLFLSPQECLDYGLITDIGLPVMSDIFPEIKLNPNYSDDMDSKLLMSFATELNPNAKNIYNFYNKTPKEGNNMNLDKNQYEALSATYKASGLEVISFDDFKSFPEKVKASYIGSLNKSMENVDKPQPTPVAVTTSQPEVKPEVNAIVQPEIKPEVTQATTPTASLSDERVTALALKLEATHAELEAIKKRERESQKAFQKKEDEMYVENLIRSENIPPAMRSQAVRMLSNASSEQMIKTIVAGQEVTMSYKDEVKNFLSNLAKTEHARANHEIAEAGGEFFSVDKELIESEGVKASEALAMEANHRKVVEYAKANGIDINDKYKGTQNYAAARAAVFGK